jgi:uncharacterized glyoxalase superfamily protein PhnB
MAARRSSSLPSGVGQDLISGRGALAGDARTGGIVPHVRDVDAHHERTRAAGATILREPTDEDYGQREHGLRDSEGHDWYIATPFDAPAS